MIMMNELDFSVSYNSELREQTKQPAPRLHAAMGPLRFTIPVTVTVMARSNYLLAGPGNPISEQASPHEITFGIVADDDEAELAQLILEQYRQHPKRQAGLTGGDDVAELIDRLNGLCNRQGTLFIQVGEKLTERFGQIPAVAAVHIVRTSEQIAADYRSVRQMALPAAGRSQ